MDNVVEKVVFGVFLNFECKNEILSILSPLDCGIWSVRVISFKFRVLLRI